MKKAFTLIELLVVVLIIGILSAIALPQYEKAVKKAQVAKMLPTFRSVYDAVKVHHLETGNSGSNNIADLGIQTPTFSLPGYSFISQHFVSAGPNDFTGAPERAFYCVIFAKSARYIFLGVVTDTTNGSPTFFCQTFNNDEDNCANYGFKTPYIADDIVYAQLPSNNVYIM